MQGQRPLRGHSAISSTAVAPTYPVLLVQIDSVPPCGGLVNVFAMASLLPPSPACPPACDLVCSDMSTHAPHLLRHPMALLLTCYLRGKEYSLLLAQAHGRPYGHSMGTSPASPHLPAQTVACPLIQEATTESPKLTLREVIKKAQLHLKGQTARGMHLDDVVTDERDGCGGNIRKDGGKREGQGTKDGARSAVKNAFL